MKNFVILSFFILALSCKNAQKHDIKNNIQNGKNERIQKPLKKENKGKSILSSNIQDIENEDILTAWTDEGSFWLLRFEPNKVNYEFNPSCSYTFSSKIIDNEIIFYWALNANCDFDRGLTKTFKNIHNPVLGKPFGKVKMINDTLIEVDYYYKDWVNEINQEEKQSIDTLFPRRFKKIHL